MAEEQLEAVLAEPREVLVKTWKHEAQQLAQVHLWIKGGSPSVLSGITGVFVFLSKILLHVQV